MYVIHLLLFTNVFKMKHTKPNVIKNVSVLYWSSLLYGNHCYRSHQYLSNPKTGCEIVLDIRIVMHRYCILENGRIERRKSPKINFSYLLRLHVTNVEYSKENSYSITAQLLCELKSPIFIIPKNDFSGLKIEYLLVSMSLTSTLSFSLSCVIPAVKQLFDLDPAC